MRLDKINLFKLEKKNNNIYLFNYLKLYYTHTIYMVIRKLKIIIMNS